MHVQLQGLGWFGRHFLYERQGFAVMLRVGWAATKLFGPLFLLVGNGFVFLYFWQK